MRCIGVPHASGRMDYHKSFITHLTRCSGYQLYKEKIEKAEADKTRADASHQSTETLSEQAGGGIIPFGTEQSAALLSDDRRAASCATAVSDSALLGTPSPAPPPATSHDARRQTIHEQENKEKTKNRQQETASAVQPAKVAPTGQTRSTANARSTTSHIKNTVDPTRATSTTTSADSDVTAARGTVKRVCCSQCGPSAKR